MSKIKFVNQVLIFNENYWIAKELTSSIDPDDLLFVGLALQLNCKLWTGDKKLIKGLRKNGFEKIITSEEVFQLYLENEYKRKTKKKGSQK